jgi:stage II sporulation protein E
MLQNFSQSYDQSEEKYKTNVDYKGAIAKIFTVQNICVYILTFMISMVGFGANEGWKIAPFGLAMVAACISAGLPMVMVYIAGMLGTAIKFGGQATLIYIFTSIVLLMMVLIKKPVKNEDEAEKTHLGAYLFLSTFAVQLICTLIKGMYIYDILVAITLSVAGYIFYKIFVNSINVISEYGIKKVFSVEEVIGASLLVAIAVSALGQTSIMTFNIRNILCIFMVLVLGWRNGVLVGGVSGITVGIVLGIIGDGTPTVIAAYAISGMIAGLLNRCGKIGVIVGFIIGNILIAYSANGGMSNIIMFQEILIASVGLLAMPKVSKISIDKIMPQTKLLPEAGRAIEGDDEAIDKLNSISKTISEMANNYREDDFYEQNEQLFEDELIKSLDGMEDNLLYDDLYNNEDGILEDVFNNLQENGILTENGLISICAKHNIYLMNSDNIESNNEEQTEIRKVLKVINSSYRICKVNFVWQKKMDEVKSNMSEQLKSVKSAIEDITGDMTHKAEEDKFADKKQQIIDELKNKNIQLQDINIKQEESGRYIINAYTSICNDVEGKLCPIKPISRIASKVLGDQLTIQDQKCGIRLNKEMCNYTYISANKYIIQSGIAKAKKDGSIVSGDMISQIRLGDGKYMYAISDGMGSGPDAMKNSKIAISMLERLLGSGFDKDTSIKLINSAILTANKDDNYATLDISILDLYAGNMELLKNGACPTYVKKNRNVSLIKSTSLPTGIMKNIQIDTYDKDLEDGDIVVMCSDGILDSNMEFANRDLWLKYLLEDIQTDIPERIADIILREAIDNCVGKPKDDMSVIVFKVMKK